MDWVNSFHFLSISFLFFFKKKKTSLSVVTTRTINQPRYYLSTEAPDTSSSTVASTMPSKSPSSGDVQIFVTVSPADSTSAVHCALDRCIPARQAIIVISAAAKKDGHATAGMMISLRITREYPGFIARATCRSIVRH